MVDTNSFLQAPLHHVWVMGSSLTCENNSHITLSPVLCFLLLLTVELVRKHRSWTRMEESEAAFSRRVLWQLYQLVKCQTVNGEWPESASPTGLCHSCPSAKGKMLLSTTALGFTGLGRGWNHTCAVALVQTPLPLEEKRFSQEYSEQSSQINKQLTVKAGGINNTVLSTG